MLNSSHKPTPGKRRNAPFGRALRTSAGVYLVELLVAITLGTMILFTLTSMLSTTLRLGATTQNELYAQEILEDLMEFTRGAGYAFFEGKKGSHSLLTNKLTPSEFGPAVRIAPLQMDCVAREWNESTKGSRFKGIATLVVEDGPEPSTLKVTVKVAWTDGTSYNQASGNEGREISKSTVITKNGTDKYAVWME